MMKKTIPTNWAHVQLNELIAFAIGGDWGKDPTHDNPNYTSVYCIRGSELKNWDKNKGNTASLRKIKKSSLITRTLNQGDILLEISGGGPEQPVGRTALIDKTVLSFDASIPKICTNFFRLLRPHSQINSSYLNYYLLFFYKSGEIVKYQAGSNNLRNLKFDQYLSITVPIPPINEQKRIVAKIEELFSELDNGIESLKAAREQLKVYRQAVLKHAFEGKFTASWREQNKDELETADQLLEHIKQEREAQYQTKMEEWKTATTRGQKLTKPQKLKDLKPLLDIEMSWLPELPNNWFWERLGWITCGVEYGTSAKSAELGDVPVLRMGNIQNMKFDLSDLAYTSESKEIEKYLLKNGDVLFNRTNSPELVGKTAIYKGERPAIFAGYLIRINQIKHIVNTQYLNFYLNSSIAKQIGNRVKTDGVNQSNINGDKLVHYPFPFCSIEEQDIIARNLEEQFICIDKLEEDIVAELNHAEVLRQSILKKAFSGKLVTQDANDEPASVLLERIRTEKETYLANNKSKHQKDVNSDNEYAQDYLIEEAAI